MPVSRWNQGRTDIVKYDHRQSQYNGESFYDARKIFIGLSPDRSTLLFQRLSQSQAFVNVGRESTVARETSDLDSSFYQARLGTAAFSNDGRLALLPEAGGGNIDES